MADAVSAELHVRASYLRKMLKSNDRLQIANARDRLRASMVAGYRTNYWRDKPSKLREYMQLLYSVDRRLARFGPDLALAERTDAALDCKRA